MSVFIFNVLALIITWSTPSLYFVPSLHTLLIIQWEIIYIYISGSYRSEALNWSGIDFGFEELSLRDKTQALIDLYSSGWSDNRKEF